MPTVLIPTAYRGPTQGISEVEVEAGSARACLEAVEAQHPGFADLVFDKQGGLHRFVTLFINGDQLDDAPLDQAVGETDRLEVLAAIAGG